MYRTAFLVLLAGCATSSAVYTPDGSKGHSITCGGDFVWEAKSWQACYKEAGSLCGTNGYEILERIENDDKREMLIACRP